MVTIQNSSKEGLSMMKQAYSLKCVILFFGNS